MEKILIDLIGKLVRIDVKGSVLFGEVNDIENGICTIKSEMIHLKDGSKDPCTTYITISDISAIQVIS